MKIRVMCTESELESGMRAVLSGLAEAGWEVASVSKPYPNRGASQEFRFYVDANRPQQPPAPPAPTRQAFPHVEPAHVLP